MEFRVQFSEDPGFVLRSAGAFLSSEPVLHNMVLSILHARLATGDPGRYWIAFHGEKAAGVVLQSPLNFPATLTPMESRAVLAMVDAIAEAGVTLPGVNGDAATAASFAGQWGERCKCAATPLMGMRLYELLEMGEAPRTEGRLRQAGPGDRNLMVSWTRAFQKEIGESASDTELRVDRGLAAGQLWVWDQNGETTSMAVSRDSVARRGSAVWSLYATREAKAWLRGSLRSCFVKATSRRRVSVRPLHGPGQPHIQFHLPANWI